MSEVLTQIATHMGTFVAGATVLLTYVKFFRTAEDSRRLALQQEMDSYRKDMRNDYRRLERKYDGLERRLAYVLPMIALTIADLAAIRSMVDDDHAAHEPLDKIGARFEELQQQLLKGLAAEDSEAHEEAREEAGGE